MNFLEKTLSVLFLSLLPVWALAGEYPAFFDVTGVASNDTLNVRAGPMASAQKLAELGPYQSNIEIVGLSANRKWGMLNIVEGSGWVSMRYLARQPGQPGDTLTRPLSCFGTEPFWALDIGGGPDATFSLAGEGDQPLSIQFVTRSLNRLDRYGIVAHGASGAMTGMISVAACNDGMSDRNYGLSVDLILGATQYSGCCTLVP